MIKNDRWIQFMATSKGMIHPYVDKQIGEGIISYGPSSFGYDMRAGFSWKIFTDVNGAIVDPKQQDDNAFHSVECIELPEGSVGEPIIIPPNSYALTHSLETVRMPRNVTAICVGKSTYARCGIHVNVTPLEAGWEGQVTIEISNGTRLPVKVYPGEGIMQVLFFEGEEPLTSYADRKGKYQNQTGIALARVLQKTVATKATVHTKVDPRKKPERRTGKLDQPLPDRSGRRYARKLQMVPVIYKCGYTPWRVQIISIYK